MARLPRCLVEQQRTLGRYLAALREAAGLYQADIARAVPCHRTTVTHTEAGSQLPDSYFWETADRVIGAKGELIASYDELIQARTTHVAEQQIKRRTQAQITARQLARSNGSTSQVESSNAETEIREPVRERTYDNRPSSSLGYATSKIGLGVSPVEFLSRISAQTPTPSQLGWTDVEHMRATTQALAASENLFGGGFSCEAAAAQLKWAGRLLDARASDDVRRAIFEAVGNLSGVVAFSSFDIADFVTSDQCFQFALWCADQGGSWDLRASILSDMSRQAVFIGKVDEALSLIELSQVRSDRISGTTRAMLSALRARLLALLGRYGEALAEVDRADEYFTARNADDEPPWMCYYDDAEHQGSTGRALIPVAESNLDLVAGRLRKAVELHTDSYPRSRAFSRTRLANLILKIGDPDEGVMIGHQAVTDAASFRSKRIVEELHGLSLVAGRYSHNPEVFKLRSDIKKLCSVQ
ncbi:MAG: helix-turn-helix domain-containing protein [Pseudonocardiaceae bacterium]